MIRQAKRHTRRPPIVSAGAGDSLAYWKQLAFGEDVGNDKLEQSKSKSSAAVGPRPPVDPFVRRTPRVADALLVDVAGFGAIVDAIIARGDGITVARTRDGGAISITILSGDSRPRGYAGGQAELDELFAGLGETYLP